MAERAQKPIAGTRRAGITAAARNRILALDVRPRMCGFAVLETPARLLDWGMRRFESATNSSRAAVSARIRPLLHSYKPRVVVVRSRNYYSPDFNRRMTAILRSIRAEAELRSIRFRILTSSQVQRRLSPDGLLTKHQIATDMAHRFEALSSRLPPPRKRYRSESVAMLVFDAVAVGMAFLAPRGKREGTLR